MSWAQQSVPAGGLPIVRLIVVGPFQLVVRLERWELVAVGDEEALQCLIRCVQSSLPFCPCKHQGLGQRIVNRQHCALVRSLVEHAPSKEA